MKRRLIQSTLCLLMLVCPLASLAESVIAGFTYSDEYASLVSTDLANLRNSNNTLKIIDGILYSMRGERLGKFYEYELPNSISLMIPGSGLEEKLLHALDSEALPSIQNYILDRIFFLPGNTQFDEDSNEQIQNLVELLTAYPTIRLLVRGHTDSTGTEKSNIEISLQRAELVKHQLMMSGIMPERIETKGMGDSIAYTSNDTKEGRALNRRIDISIIK